MFFTRHSFWYYLTFLSHVHLLFNKNYLNKNYVNGPYTLIKLTLSIFCLFAAIFSINLMKL